MPPLPPIPETFKPNVGPKRIGRFFDRSRHKAEPSNTAANVKTVKKSDNSSLLKLSRGKRKAHLKSQISDPALCHAGSLPLPMLFDKKTDEDRRMSDSSIHSPVAIDFAPDHPAASKHEFGVAKPRLSPMEYARMYLVNKAQNEHQNRDPELPPPEKKWFWTPGWEKFLIIPRIPSVIKRDQRTYSLTDVEVDDGNSLTHTSLSSSPVACPRLSLHIGETGCLMPLAAKTAVVAATNNLDTIVSQNRDTTFSRQKSGRLPYTSDEMRSSPVSQPERSLTPLSELSQQTAFPTAHISNSPDTSSSSKRSTLNRQDSLPILLPRTYQPPVREYQNKVTSPGQSPNMPQFTTPRFMKVDASSPSPLPSSRLFSTREKQPLYVDDLTPDRIKSMAASIIGGTNINLAAQPNPALSPGILFGLPPSPHELVERSVRTSSLNWKQYTGSRRHSFGAEIKEHLHSRTPSSNSSTYYTRDALISPALYRQYLENDPFTDPRPNVSPSDQERLPPQQPRPDSPTLGHKHDEQDLLVERGSRVHEEQSFDLLKSYVRSKRRRLNQTNHDASSSSSGAGEAEGRDSTADCPGKNWPSSVFALNKAKSHEAFTLLPRLLPTYRQDKSPHSPPRLNSRSLSHPSRKLVKRRSISDKSTALALQTFDTASRLASAINEHDSSPAFTPSTILADCLEHRLETNKPSKISSFFSRRARKHIA